jgi:hypothetical protein
VAYGALLPACERNRSRPNIIERPGAKMPIFAKTRRNKRLPNQKEGNEPDGEHRRQANQVRSVFHGSPDEAVYLHFKVQISYSFAKD